MGHLHGVDGTAPAGLRWHAARTSVLLSLLFLVVYSATNWITTQRSDVGTWAFAWELALPFVPLMIVPYMSIDLFFVAAPFLCREAEELKVLARRIAFDIVVAGAFFLLLPLRLVHERPAVDGWLGVVFDWFRGMDAPHNLFPSLHITLRSLLASVYARHTRGLAYLGSHVWFSLIGLSTVLTYQHHVIDIAGGFVLAGFAFYLFREKTPRLPVQPNRRVGSYYAAAAAVVALAVVPLAPWGAFLLWPAGALGIVAAAYFGLGPGVYRKRAGMLPLSTRFVLAPVLLGQHLSLIHYRRRCRAWDEVAPGLIIGRQLSGAEAADAVRQGVTAVLDLTAEFSEAKPLLATRYLNLPVLDLTAPTPAQLDQAVAFISAEAERGTVYVHCKIGYSRSAAAIGAYLLATERAASADETIALLRRVRPTLIVRPEAHEALRDFAERSASSPRPGLAPLADGARGG